jgi:hypothetical protein
MGRFYHVLENNKDQRTKDMTRLIDQKNEVISYRKQLVRAETMSSIKPVVLNRLEGNIEKSIDALEDLKVVVKKSFIATEVKGLLIIIFFIYIDYNNTCLLACLLA